MSSSSEPLTLETVIGWAHSGHESNKVYRFLFLHPDEIFIVPPDRKWPIAHQIVYNGDVCLLKRVLALYSDHQIDISTLSRDNKTLLDVANEQQQRYPEMYQYITRLFLQQDLITAAKTKQWNRVYELLQLHTGLENEKPPYSTYFLIHYIIQNGDEKILTEAIDRFHLQLNVLTADNETPMVLAKRLRQFNMCSILNDRLKTVPQFATPTVPVPQPILPCDDAQRDEQSPDSASTTASSLPYPLNDPFPTPKFSNFLIDLNESGNMAVQKQFDFPPNPPQVSLTAERATDDERIPENIITPAVLASDYELRKHFECPLTQRVFVDPVIASDGQTYERDAITQWVAQYHCSPITGVKIEHTFKDNSELKELIDSMRKQS